MSVTQINERLAALTAAGTSVWLDQIRRGMIEDGELARMVAEDSLRGVTSNPAIFEKAILGSPDYDDDIRSLAEDGLSAREVYRRLAVRDVQLAADVLRPVHEDSGGSDGFVSLEVAPRLAHDTEGTLEQARMYWELVDRPNLMIKIPGTDEGIPAIEQALYEGLNINVTLLFAVSAYERVMEAFISAMERRRADGLQLDRHSVASFFVSRVDTEVDKRLEALGRTDLAGRAGLANARAAYRAFENVFRGERFAALRDAGCPVQRPLWASTGVKNPSYPETMYIYGLVAPDTVNTMPLATLTAAARDGEVSGATAAEDPTPDLEALAAAGIDLDDVTAKLLRDGIEAFIVPMNKLLHGIESKREAIVTGRPAAIEADLPAALEQAVAGRVRRAADGDVAHRIWQRDGTLWAPGGRGQIPEVTDRLGWLNIGEKMLDHVDELEAFAEEVRRDGYTDVVLCGMGGSSLAPEVFRRSWPVHAMTLHVLDSTHPDEIQKTLDAIDLERTLVVVSSKSGGTVETLSQFKLFHSLQPDGAHYVAVTDPGTSLASLARENGFRRVFENDPEIGGRYSALSYFGLVPAALIGVDIRVVLEDAEVAVQNCQLKEGNSGLWLGIALGELARHGRDKLTFVVDPPIESFGLWVEQLVAESTGKQGRGILPVAGEPHAGGREDVYGPDRVFLHISTGDEGNARHIAAVRAAGHPTITVRADGPADLARIDFLAEFATAVAGWVLEINPFDQPNVQEAKDNTKRVLDEGSPDLDPGDLDALLEGIAPPRYVAIMGYLPYSEETDAAVARLRERLVSEHGVATTWGYGPRFLHSTGQFHKGGPSTGAFVQIVDDPQTDIDIPGEPYSFGTLIRAQADGDLQTLRAHGLDAVRVGREVLR
jgi:transaldolase / glucose-6-phosphate isomerase